jgi:hypothetical protein
MTEGMLLEVTVLEDYEVQVWNVIKQQRERRSCYERIKL